jgi:hypothetical protein
MVLTASPGGGGREREEEARLDNKSNTRGDPWTPRFRKLLAKAGIRKRR